MLKVNKEKIILARAKSTMTVRELAKSSLIAASTITKIEKGHTNPNLITIGKIAKALNVPIEELIILNN